MPQRGVQTVMVQVTIAYVMNGKADSQEEEEKKAEGKNSASSGSHDRYKATRKTRIIDTTPSRPQAPSTRPTGERHMECRFCFQRTDIYKVLVDSVRLINRDMKRKRGIHFRTRFYEDKPSVRDWNVVDIHSEQDARMTHSSLRWHERGIEKDLT